MKVNELVVDAVINSEECPVVETLRRVVGTADEITDDAGPETDIEGVEPIDGIDVVADTAASSLEDIISTLAEEGTCKLEIEVEVADEGVCVETCGDVADNVTVVTDDRDDVRM